MSGPEGAVPPGYDFVRVLGAGGFGEVVLAEHHALHRQVAVKRIHARNLLDEEALERFRREGQLLAALEHPAVVRVYDLIRSADALHLVMEYVPGESLAGLLDAGPVSVDRALVVLRDAAEALTAAAGRGIVHRDVKPGNVLVLPSGRAKLGDFGLARVASDPRVFRTQAGPETGTPAYFPPEISQYGAEPDARSDEYSFAVMAYEVLVGRRPFEANDLMALVTAHWRLEPPDPAMLRPGFPPVATAALLQGLAKDPSRRPTVLELVAALESVPPDAWPPAPARPVEPMAPGERRPASATVLVSRPPTPVAPQAPPRAAKPRRRRAWLVPAALLAAVAAGAVAVVALTGSDSPTALHVQRVEIATEPADGVVQCPDHELTLTATVTTNGGAGELHYRWTLPRGGQTEPAVLELTAGQTTARIEQPARFEGTSNVTGDAVLDVTDPDPQSARVRVRYRCG